MTEEQEERVTTQARRAIELVEALREINQEPEGALEILLAATAMVLRLTSRSKEEALEAAADMNKVLVANVMLQFEAAAIVSQLEVPRGPLQ